MSGQLPVSATPAMSKASKKKLEEEKARKAREAARQHLRQHHCGPEAYASSGSVTDIGGVQVDNTLDVMRARKAKDKAQNLLAAQQAEQVGAASEKGACPPPPRAQCPPHQGNTLRTDLPQGWKRVADPVTGEEYFWNTMTDRTQWEHPNPPRDGPRGRAPAPKPAISKLGVDGSGGGGVVDLSGDDKRTHDYGARCVSQVPESPWVEIKDPETHDSYFWNMENGERTWQPPAGFVKRWSKDAITSQRLYEKMEKEREKEAERGFKRGAKRGRPGDDARPGSGPPGAKRERPAGGFRASRRFGSGPMG